MTFIIYNDVILSSLQQQLSIHLLIIIIIIIITWINVCVCVGEMTLLSIKPKSVSQFWKWFRCDIYKLKTNAAVVVSLNYLIWGANRIAMFVSFHDNTLDTKKVICCCCFLSLSLMLQSVFRGLFFVFAVLTLLSEQLDQLLVGQKADQHVTLVCSSRLYTVEIGVAAADSQGKIKMWCAGRRRAKGKKKNKNKGITG